MVSQMDLLDGAQKMREAGYIGYENGEFVKAPCLHEWLETDRKRFRFCIKCGKREHYSINSHKWLPFGYFVIRNKEI